MNTLFETPEQLLPHRDPFLFIDRLVECDREHTVVEKTFGTDSWFFRGHFPEYPVVPGVLLVETMAQCGGAGLCQVGILPHGAFFVLASVEKAKFRRQIRPDETVTVTVRNDRVSQAMIRQSGTVSVNGATAAEASWMCIVGTGRKGDRT